jgi:C1A family cysteine protease
MATDVLTQLRTLRESIADALRKDPRYLTLAALDKTIAEITEVLKAAGELPPQAPPSEPLRVDAVPPESAAKGHPAPPATPEPVEPESVAIPHAPSPAVDHADDAKDVAHHGLSASPAKDQINPPEKAVEDEHPKADASAATEATPDRSVPEAAASAAVEATALEVDEPQSPLEIVDAPEIDSPEPTVPPETPAVADPVIHAPVSIISAPEPEVSSHEVGHDATDETTLEPVVAEADPTEADLAESDFAEPELAEPVVAEPVVAEAAAPLEGVPDAADSHPTDGPVIPIGKASGYIPMQAKPAGTHYQPAMSVKFGKLPNKVDLRPLMTVVDDQGETPSCVANAVAGAYEYWIKKASKQDHQLSRLFVYYNARWRDGSQDRDEGSTIQFTMEGLTKFGACGQTAWPSDSRLILQRPTAEAYQDAASYKIHDMAQVPLKVEAWKQALAEGKPIVFGCALFASFNDCAEYGGIVPMPAPNDLVEKEHNIHAMCAVGYSESEKVFIVRNSWGTGFGDDGYCYMPFAYLMSPKLNDGDCWVFIPKVPSQPPRELWSDDTTPITNNGHGVTFPIEPYSVADYEHAPVDLFEAVRRPFDPDVNKDYSAYITLASRAMWGEMERFDVGTLLSSAASVAGIAAVASELSGTAADAVGSDDPLTDKDPIDEANNADEDDEAWGRPGRSTSA